MPAILTTALLLVSVSGLASAEDIILRLRPEAKAPIITRITATEKVLLDAAPVVEKSEWMQLDLKIPFEGYVPTATLTKSFAIVQDTAVHFLPDANSEVITRAKDGDFYEVKSVKDEWATIRLNKQLKTYYRAGALPSTAPTQEVEPAPKPPVLDLSIDAPTHTPEPKAADFDPALGVGQTSPDDLPPENVVWKSAPRTSEPIREPQLQAATKETSPPNLPKGIMVSPGQTQAREANAKKAPAEDKPLRLLVGNLVRKIETSAPAYPIRLRSDEGRLIAYVDFSGYFIEDLSPYLNQRVYLRGHLEPVPSSEGDLVLFVRDIRLAD
ncbi:hypothetical protein [Coraliomargarita sinensis]|uniref:hypothetical protein n=1 Tax=Coraliomargarita sinensis TaxID=2174842 RepID=UPI0011B39AE7|nr:hypothetical protein [Coraliomargarita sinensis]